MTDVITEVYFECDLTEEWLKAAMEKINCEYCEDYTLIATPETAAIAGRLAERLTIKHLIILGNLKGPDNWALIGKFRGVHSFGA